MSIDYQARTGFGARYLRRRERGEPGWSGEEGYEQGRLRLLYEANPIAMLVEQADGYATTGDQRMLDVQPREFHQRIPLIFGSRKEIRRIEDYYAGRNMTAARSELFREHGLFNT